MSREATRTNRDPEKHFVTFDSQLGKRRISTELWLSDSQVSHPLPLVRPGREPDCIGEAADHHYQWLISDVVG